MRVTKLKTNAFVTFTSTSATSSLFFQPVLTIKVAQIKSNRSKLTFQMYFDQKSMLFQVLSAVARERLFTHSAVARALSLQCLYFIPVFSVHVGPFVEVFPKSTIPTWIIYLKVDFTQRSFWWYYGLKVSIKPIQFSVKSTESQCI